MTFSKRYLLWWDCILIVGERNFPECRAAAAGWPEPRWPGDGGILPDAAEAPSRCDSMASPESSGGGTWTDLGAPPKSRPSIIHSIKNNNNKNCFRMSLIIKIKTTSASVDFQANPCPYPALCRPTKKTNKKTKNDLDKYRLVILKNKRFIYQVEMRKEENIEQGRDDAV